MRVKRLKVVERKITETALLFATLFFSSASMADPLKVLDANDLIVGDVLTVDRDVIVPLKVGSRVALVAVGRNGFVHRSFAGSDTSDRGPFLLWENRGCTGKLYMAVETLPIAGPPSRATLYPRSTVQEPGDTLYIQLGNPAESAIFLSTSGGKYSGCRDESTQQTLQGHLLTPVADLSQLFTAPFKLDASNIGAIAP